MLYVMDADQIKRIMRASNDATPNPFIHDMVLGQMLGSPAENIQFYKNDNGRMDHTQMAPIRQHVTGSSLTILTKKVFERLKYNIGVEYAQHGEAEWMDIPDLFIFVQNHVTAAITEALMGTSITSSYKGMVTDLWTLVDFSHEMVLGLPRFVISGAYDARDRLLDNIRDWSRASEALREQGAADPVWDPEAGSGLLQERQQMFKKTPTFNEDARCSQILGLLFGGNSLTPPVTFWYLYHALHDLKLSQRVRSEIQNHFNNDIQEYAIQQLVSRPILQSLHAEATRCYASNISIRIITTPTFALDDKYTIKEGTMVLIHNKFTGLYTPGWTNTRASTTQKPLEEFRAERFLVGEEGKAEKFNDSKLEGSWTSFGGGEHKCPGRHFARNIGIVALAVRM